MGIMKRLNASHLVSASLFASCLAMIPSTPAFAADSIHVPMKPLSGSRVDGSVHFTVSDGKMSAKVELSGLEPGEHGFHIHEVGDCNAVDGSSAGPHFNPDGHKHGGIHAADRHAGDLGNVTADAAGKVEVELKDLPLTFDGAKGIKGRSVIVHEKRDDLATDPSGDSGKRLACGIIGQK